MNITDSEMDRLRKAKETKKYGHLMSWKELYLYQRYCGAKKEQVIQIGLWAKRKIRGERIVFPLMNNGIQEAI